MRDGRQFGRRLGILLLAALFAAPNPPVAADSAGADSAFDRAVVPAAGRQTATLKVAELGRYAISVESASGTALQVVDRMAGAGAVAGAAGEHDGRVDLFLDRGDVRVVTLGNRLATGDARLVARRFVDRSPAAAERLVEGRVVSAELGDLEERSWWLEIAKRRSMVIEAAGRDLAELRLWQNGAWLVDATPAVSEIEPLEGRPLRLLQLAVDLAPGTYRLTAYGGEERAWSRGGSDRPLYLRAGIPRDAVALRERRTVSPFGFDRVLVAGAADHFQVELAEARDASLEVFPFDAEQPFDDSEAWSATILPESRPPVALLQGAREERDRVVIVRAAAGTPYVLEHFPRENEKRLGRPGRYWIGTVDSGAAGDSIDGTALLVELGDGRKRPARVVGGDVPAIAAGAGSAGWSGRFNLAAATTLQFEVKAAGEFEVRSSGVAAQARIEPFFVTPPDGFEPAPLRTPPAAWSLDPGYYVLELVPVEAGIAEIELAPKGSPKLVPAPRGAATLGVVELATNREYLVRTNSRPATPTAIVARELPLDLVAALPVALAPGEVLEVPFRAPAASRLAARDERGETVELAVDGGEFRESAEVGEGPHSVRLRGGGDEIANASLALTLLERESGSPLPPLSAAAIEALAATPPFPELAAGTSAQPLDLERREAASYRLAAPEPALYRIETHGLLATEAALRTRIVPSLLDAAENGVGRNARLSAYLSSGEYQLTVRARGESAGHLGVALARSPIVDGGRLFVAEGAVVEAAPQSPARATLAPGEALSYTFDVATAGLYRASARGLVRSFRLRLEDADGWPVGEPFAEGAQTAALEPGSYRLLVLPQPVEARAAIAVERMRSEEEAAASSDSDEMLRRTKGEPLPLDRDIGRVWREAPPGEKRGPDRFIFDLPAPTTVSIRLTPEMSGELLRAAEPRAAVATLKPGRGFRGHLERGRYELEVRATMRDEGRGYRLGVFPDDFVDGVRRPVSAPADLHLAVGVESDVELTSYGGIDLRARLYDAAGRELAAADDRPGDWNFLLQRRLAPGRYRLHVDAAGSKSGVAPEVEMRVPRERAEAAIQLGAAAAAREVELASEVVLVPLATPAAAGIVAAGVRAAESVGVTLEERRGDRWHAVASAAGREAAVALPLSTQPNSLRLRIASLDRRPVKVKLTARAAALAKRSESDLARGFALERLAGVEPAVAAAVVDLAAPGCFRRGDDSGVLQALAAGEPYVEAAPTLAAVGLAIPLAAIGADAANATVRATRARVGEGAPLSITLAPASPVLCDVADGGAAQVELVATSGEPVVGFVSEGGGWGGSTELGAPGSGRAFAAAPAGRGRAVEIWNAGAGRVEARLMGTLAVEMAPAADARIAGALATWKPPVGRVVPLALPAGEKGVELAVAAGGAALLLAGDEPVAYLHEAGGSALERVVTKADRVLIFGANPNAGGAPAEDAGLVAVSVQPVPANAPVTGPAAGKPYERRFASATRIRMPIAPVIAAGAPARLEVRGAARAVLLGADGSVARGDSLPVPKAGGELRLEVEPGFVAVWRDEGAGAPAIASGLPPQRLAPPAVVALAGSERAFDVEVRGPALLSLRSANALALSASSGGKLLASEAYAGTAAFDLVAPAGVVRLGLRGLAGEPLAGSALVTATPLAPLSEGLGEELLLAPGESRGYSLKLARAGEVGVGVRADRAGVDARLFDAAGAELGRGAAIWRELPAGSYALVVTAPAEGAPARIRTALVGTAAPSDAPPREEVERFLALAGAAPPVARGVAGEEDRYRAPWKGDEGDENDGEDEGDDESPRGEYGSDEEDEGEDE